MTLAYADLNKKNKIFAEIRQEYPMKAGSKGNNWKESDLKFKGPPRSWLTAVDHIRPFELELKYVSGFYKVIVIGKGSDGKRTSATVGTIPGQ